jgi:murein L,D-transpeptidase YafK
MRTIRAVIAIGLLLGLASCSTSKFRTYNGPEVTRVVVNKADRKMHLLHHDKVLKSYNVDLGFDPAGHKQFEGDGRTPEGEYVIDRRNPNSQFHLSIGISYPNAEDVTRARMAGLSPGGDIFIHGESKRGLGAKRDWTFGCIAVTNREMEDIYAKVKTGTPILVNP